ncbi:MAG: chorismate synthase [Candidatus Bathyarchaeia archaeon]
MPPNTLGVALALTVFGESHGRCVGMVLDGCPAGLEVSERDLEEPLRDRVPRVPGLSSGRAEEDKVEILSGVFRGRTTGAPICALVWNRDVEDQPYLELEGVPRPGHADYPAYVRYGGFHDFRGGGIFSGRMTVPYIMGGTIALKLLSLMGVEVLAYTVEIAGIRAGELDLDALRRNTHLSPVRCGDLEASKLMVARILEAAGEGDSVGGVVEAQALGLPPGLGDPIFDSIDSDLAKFLLAVPGVKGVEFGSGFEASRMKGSSFNDQYVLRNGRVAAASNNAGGILGGLTTGMPLKVRVAFKPTPSISKPQASVDLRSMEPREITVRGRHDPCIVPKAVPVVRSVVAVVLADHLIRAAVIPRVLRGLASDWKT